MTTLEGTVPKMFATTSDGGIPENWECVTIATLLERGATIKTGPFGTLLKAAEYSVDGVPVVSVGEIGAGSLNITSETPRVPPEVTKRLPEYRLRTGDIVFGRKGAVDRSALIRANQDGWFLGSDGIRLRLPGNVAPEFVIYQLQRPEARDWLTSNSVGTTMASLNQEVIGRVPIILAPEIEQRAIATALSDVDALIGAIDKLIAKKRAIKLATMQRLLTGSSRLAGLERVPGLQRTPVGKIPKDWEVRSFSELCLKIQDGTHFSPRVGGDDYLYVTSRNIGFGFLDLTDMDRIDAAQHRAIYLRCDVQEGDLLLTKDGANTGNAAINTIGDECSLLSSVAFLRFKSSSDARFFLQYVLSRTGQQRLKDLMSGNAITRLTLQKIRCFPVPVPRFQEQVAIADILSGMDAEIAAVERRRDKTKAIKQGMMQQLLTGKVRMV